MADVLPRVSKGVRDAEAADIPAIAALYAEIEPEDPITAEGYRQWWSWLHLANPHGVKLALGGFAPDGACEGHLTMIPFLFSIDGEEVLAGFSCQLMVAEKKRQSLLYPSLIGALFREYKARGAAFLYSTVVRPRVMQANIAVGFKPGVQVAVYARPYHAEPLLRRVGGRLAGLAAPFAPLGNQILKIGRGKSDDVDVERIKAFPAEIDELWARMKPRLRLAAVRNAKTLNWRFFGDSGRAYNAFLAKRAGKVVGYVVIREMPMREFNTLAVVDILHDPDDVDAADALLSVVHEEAKRRKVDLASAALPPGSPFRPALSRRGFLRTPEFFTLITHEPKGVDRITSRPQSDWHLTWFDHDFV